ncbi:MAG: hybrid sensor histidine kinase/response regulator transcription factor [Bacteroidales bacterium]
MNRFSLLFFLVLFAFTAEYSRAIPNKISFSHLSVKEGLSQNTVLDIAQDSIGNMWFATTDGVNRFDGYHFKIYRHRNSDSLSIGHDNIYTICKDRKNRMWFGTRKGLSLYNAEKDIFTNYLIREGEKDSEVRCIVAMSDTTLLIGIDNRINLFDIRTGTVSESGLSRTLKNLSATSFLKRRDQLYIGTMNGLYRYDITRRTLQDLHPEFGKRRIQSLLLQNEETLWVGTEGAGLYRMDLTTDEIRHFRHEPQNKRSISSDYIRSLAVDRNQQLWIGTFKELNIYNEQNDSFDRMSHDPFQKESLSQNSIRALYKDVQGGMWIGTYYGGLNYYHPLKNRFHTIRRTPSFNSLNDNNISCMLEDNSGDFWVAGMNNGLNKQDAETGFYQSYDLGLKKTHNIKTLHYDSLRNILYLGAHAGGFNSLNLKTNKITNYIPENSDIKDENIYAILPLDKNNLLLGALNGCEIFNQQTGEFGRHSDLKDCRRVTSLLRDRSEQIWIGMDHGIALFRFMDNDFQPESSPIIDKLKGTRVNGLYQANDGSLWFATVNGIWNLKENQIRHYTTEEGLTNNVIYGILEDDAGNLWLSTNNGISALDPNTGRIRNYTDEEGIENTQFNMFSFYKRRSGELCFGGDKGITCFYADRIEDNAHTPAPRIHELKLFNRTVLPGDESGILEKSMEFTRHITLKASQNVFSLGFVVSDYVSGKNNCFSYTLEGFDKEWYPDNGYNFVSYSNLPAGNYTFKVRAANNDNYMHEQPAVLQITILPVWYKTLWAIVLFSLMLICSVLFVIRYFWVQRMLRNEIHLQKLEREKIDELNQMKLRFFINISHELRTPLSLIIDPIQDIIRSTSDKKIRVQLDYARRNAMRLLRLVNQLLDYRKAELGVLNLKVRQCEIHQALRECFESYEKLARNKQINYSFISEIENTACIVDLNYVELIVNNFLSNAFKYTPEGGTIELNAGLNENNLVISVKDDGIGIKEEDQQFVFDRFYQVSPENSGSGIGLSLVKKLVEIHHGTIDLRSRTNSGSVFTIHLPQNEEVYAMDEWAEEDDEGFLPDKIIPNEENEFLLLTEEAGKGRQLAGMTKKIKLLLVEDNDEIRQYLQDALNDYFEITAVENGSKAIECLQDELPEVVLSDVMMPVMDGIKMCSRIKNNIRTSHLPVILLSAKTEECFQLEAYKTGADDYIAKPFSTPLLIRKIQGQVRNRQRINDHLSRNIQVEPANCSFSVIDEEFLSKAKAYVEKQIANPDFSTDDFARQMHMSRSNLHLKLKSVTGESAIEFIRKIRFNKACQLLEEGRYSVGEISGMVGFSSQSYFSATFKKYLGCLPSEYVKRKRMIPGDF